MTKRIFISLGIVSLLLIGCIWYVGRARDCDLEARQVQEMVQNFTNIEGGTGRCDGLCIKGSIMGCTISDDAHAWFVNNDGVIRQVE